MKTTATTTDELNEIYDFAKNKFISDPFKGSFHNLLWQLIVNRIAEKEAQSFYDVYHEGEYLLARVIKNKAGFISTGVVFKSGITDKEAADVCVYLNKKCFNQSSKTSDKIISSSFSNQIESEDFLKD